jgi:O-Antigen ligase
VSQAPEAHRSTWGRRHAVPIVGALGGRATGAVTCGVTAVALAAIGGSRGGYYPTAWGWATVAALAVAACVLLRTGGASLERPALLTVAALGGLLLWTALSAGRPGGATRGMPEVERDLLYLSVAWCALLVVRSSTVAGAIAGCLVGIVVLVAIGLVDLLLPAHASADLYEGRLLFQPVGYANAMGILAAAGLLIALGVFTCERARWIRAACAAAIVPLTVALQLSGSRGAEVAAAVALTFVVVTSVQRRAYAGALVALLPIPLATAATAAQSSVGDPAAPSASVLHDGRLVAAALVTATLAQAALADALVSRAPSSVLLSRTRNWIERFALPGVCVSLAALIPAGAVLVAGRLAGERIAYWRVAWAAVRAHPFLGSGAGSYAADWLRLRPDGTSALNAHNLYLETLAELGPLGLGLLLAFLGIPLACAVRARGVAHPGALAAYVALVVHAALDWDWQLPVVVTAQIVCGAALLVPIASRHPRRAVLRAPRYVLACTALAALLAAAAAVGASALAASEQSAVAGSWRPAARFASLAARWEPWSATPLRIDAEVAAAQRQNARARHLFAEAAARDPSDWLAWYGLVRVGTRAEQRTALARIAALNPRAVVRTP